MLLRQGGSGCARPYIPFDDCAAFALGLGEIVHSLKIEPELGTGPEKPREPKGSIRGHRSLTFDDRANPGRWDPERYCERIRRKTERLDEFLA
jgi:hypothetical protein